MLRTRRARRKLDHLPVIVIQTAADFRSTSFTAPSPTYTASVLNAEGARVGTMTFAVSPLLDRVYVMNIQVFEPYFRQGYATAMLWYLAQTYGQPITAVKELATDFWNVARDLNLPGLVVTTQISTSEMPQEKARWQHLQPEAERLQRVIEERIFVHREPYHVAIGRGLEQQP